MHPGPGFRQHQRKLQTSDLVHGIPGPVVLRVLTARSRSLTATNEPPQHHAQGARREAAHGTHGEGGLEAVPADTL